MTRDDLQSLISLGETETVEFKKGTGARRAAMQTLCGMLNHRGGWVLFGIDPTGKIIGADVGEHTVEKLSDEFKLFEPPVIPSIEQVPVESRRAVLVVKVRPGTEKPYLYRHISYCRIGSTTKKMPADEYNRLLFERMHSERRWENQIAPSWTLENLDADEIERTAADAIRCNRLEDRGQQMPLEVLRGLGLVSRSGKLHRAAVVLFGSEEYIRNEMPQCLLRVARIKGVDSTDEFMDNRQFRGNAFALLRSAERFLRDTLPIPGRFESGRFERLDEPLYPLRALREILANALCHRDYSIGGGSVGVAIYDDRLEVTSSGSLHFGLTPEKLFVPHDSLRWNPLIAHAFYLRGFIEEWGRGTLNVLKWLTDAELPRPEIEDAGGCVMVRFRRAQKLTDLQKTLLSLLADTDFGLALRDLQKKLEPEIGRKKLQRELAALRQMGLVFPSGFGRGARWKRS